MGGASPKENVHTVYHHPVQHSTRAAENVLGNRPSYVFAQKSTTRPSEEHRENN